MNSASECCEEVEVHNEMESAISEEFCVTMGFTIQFHITTLELN